MVEALTVIHDHETRKTTPDVDEVRYQLRTMYKDDERDPDVYAQMQFLAVARACGVAEVDLPSQIEKGEHTYLGNELERVYEHVVTFDGADEALQDEIFLDENLIQRINPHLTWPDDDRARALLVQSINSAWLDSSGAFDLRTMNHPGDIEGAILEGLDQAILEARRVETHRQLVDMYGEDAVKGVPGFVKLLEEELGRVGGKTYDTSRMEDAMFERGDWLSFMVLTDFEVEIPQQDKMEALLGGEIDPKLVDFLRFSKRGINLRLDKSFGIISAPIVITSLLRKGDYYINEDFISYNTESGLKNREALIKRLSDLTGLEIPVEMDEHRVWIREGESIRRKVPVLEVAINAEEAKEDPGDNVAAGETDVDAVEARVAELLDETTEPASPNDVETAGAGVEDEGALPVVEVSVESMALLKQGLLELAGEWDYGLGLEYPEDLYTAAWLQPTYRLTVLESEVEVDPVPESEVEVAPCAVITPEMNQAAGVQFVRKIREQLHTWPDVQHGRNGRPIGETSLLWSSEVEALGDRYGVPMQFLRIDNQNHFVLVTAQLGENRFMIYDPLRNGEREYTLAENDSVFANRTYEAGKGEYNLQVDEGHLDRKVWDCFEEHGLLDAKSVDLQHDGHNCGLYVVLMAVMRAGCNPGMAEGFVRGGGKERLLEDTGLNLLTYRDMLPEPEIRILETARDTRDGGIVVPVGRFDVPSSSLPAGGNGGDGRVIETRRGGGSLAAPAVDAVLAATEDNSAAVQAQNEAAERRREGRQAAQRSIDQTVVRLFEQYRELDDWRKAYTIARRKEREEQAGEAEMGRMHALEQSMIETQQQLWESIMQFWLQDDELLQNSSQLVTASEQVGAELTAMFLEVRSGNESLLGDNGLTKDDTIALYKRINTELLENGYDLGWREVMGMTNMWLQKNVLIASAEPIDQRAVRLADLSTGALLDELMRVERNISVISNNWIEPLLLRQMNGGGVDLNELLGAGFERERERLYENMLAGMLWVREAGVGADEWNLEEGAEMGFDQGYIMSEIGQLLLQLGADGVDRVQVIQRIEDQWVAMTGVLLESAVTEAGVEKWVSRINRAQNA